MTEQWHKYIIQSTTIKEAARYAADRSWWLHSWTWLESQTAPLRVYINIDYLDDDLKFRGDLKEDFLNPSRK